MERLSRAWYAELSDYKAGADYKKPRNTMVASKLYAAGYLERKRIPAITVNGVRQWPHYVYRLPPEETLDA